ncbi:MAG: TolC family protein, partial [Fusobacteriaceae bacterium]
KVSENRFFNLEVANKINITPSKTFLSNFIKVISIKEKNSPLLQLETAVRFGIDNNPKLRATFNRELSANYRYMSDFGKRFPQVSGTLGYNYLQENAVTPMTNDENSVTGGIQISQVIFNTDLNAQIFTQKILYENARLGFKEQTDLLRQEITNSYLDVLQKQASLEIEKSNYLMLQDFLQISKTKYKVGSVGAQNVYRLEAALANADTALISAETELKNSEIKLNKILNLKPDTPHSYETFDNIIKKFEVADVTMRAMNFNLESKERIKSYFVDNAFKNSNNLRIAENRILDLDSQYKSVMYSRFIPEIKGYGKYNYDDINSWGKDSGRDTVNYWNAGIALELPLFKSGEIHNKQKSLKAEREAVTLERDEIKNEVEKEMSIGLNMTLGAFNQIMTTKNATQSSKKYLDIIVRQYKVGSIDVMNLLEAKNSFLSSQMSNVMANYLFFNSLISVEKAYGQYIFLSDDEATKKKVKTEIESLIKR